MSFVNALRLVRLLEGGKHKANIIDPNDTNCGIIQSTWEGLGFRGSVFNASDADVASAYHSLWSRGGASVYDSQTGGSRSLFELIPEPVDAFAFQFYINVPPRIFKEALQLALSVPIDGSMGPKTLSALARIDKDNLLYALAHVQKFHYHAVADPAVLQGLLNRVDKSLEFCLDL